MSFEDKRNLLSTTAQHCKSTRIGHLFIVTVKASGDF